MYDGIIRYWKISIMGLTRTHLIWIVSAMLIVSLCAGFVMWRNTLRNQASMQLGSLFYQASEARYQESELEKIANSNESQYSFLAKMKLAELAFQRNDKEEALSIYRQVIKNTKAQKFIRDTAIYLSANAAFSMGHDISNILETITKNNFIYQGSGKFLKGLFLAKQEQFEKAAPVFEEIQAQYISLHHMRIQAQGLSNLYK